MDVKNAKSVIQLSYTDEFEIADLKERRLFINGEIDSCDIDSIVYQNMLKNKKLVSPIFPCVFEHLWLLQGILILFSYHI